MPPSHEADSIVDDFARFVQASPSSYHAAVEVAERAVEAGFTWLEESEDWPGGPGKYVVVRDGAVIAWVQPEASGALPVRVLGAHTDSPGFKLKPTPDVRGNGWKQASVEVYGGPLLNSWLDRELELAGRVATRDGRVRLVRTGPMLRIPQLAIHLDRGVNNDGVALDKQRQTQPIWGVEAAEGDLAELIAARAGIDVADIAGHDILTVDTQPPARFGDGAVFLASPRMDNLTSVHAGLRALLDAPSDAGHISMLAAFDHEELGSNSRSGASGPFLEDVLVRINEGMGATDASRRRALAASWCLSADAGHAVHPNYPERHDPTHRPAPGGGVLLKVNANQRYASDAVGAAMWARACEAADVATQPFVSNNTIPCGSTIGPLTATRLGMRTVDVGVPLLSMHSARELVHVDDLVGLGLAVGAFFAMHD
ncbi:M18 family aminopeptidase [Agromyces rhizosphaerae]|uniref:M18 family aminopeptidase n=1 Tax=Agromyces rhizosphaerae TaxID=88374 RepID=A0A9W6CSM7_9MICO|nr:M18 family aminopeptidase [Agromyces rhizosphaerae]GLI28241.1 M18 family aminopeptidase [Agromyces rhizosphaerae]